LTNQKRFTKQAREQWHGLYSSFKQPISLLSFSPGVRKAQKKKRILPTPHGSSKTSRRICFPHSALRRGLLPFLEGNRDFWRFRTYARDQTDCGGISTSGTLTAADVSKNKNRADVFLAVAF
jgi:hypothetical protein